MAVALPVLRQTQLETVQHAVAEGNCVAVFGLSNTGKSPFMRALAAPDSQARLAQLAGRASALHGWQFSPPL